MLELHNIRKEYVFFGKIVIKNKRWTMEQPTIYEPSKYDEIAGLLQPVYGLTSGLTNNLIIKTMKTVLSDVDLIADYIPADIRKRYGLCEYNYALKQIHFPDSMDNLIEARRCLVFHEFFIFLMGIQYQKVKKVKEKNVGQPFYNPNRAEGIHSLGSARQKLYVAQQSV